MADIRVVVCESSKQTMPYVPLPAGHTHTTQELAKEEGAMLVDVREVTKGSRGRPGSGLGARGAGTGLLSGGRELRPPKLPLCSCVPPASLQHSIPRPPHCPSLLLPPHPHGHGHGLFRPQPSELASRGYVAGAVNMPMSSLRKQLASMSDKTKKVYVYCQVRAWVGAAAGSSGYHLALAYVRLHEMVNATCVK